jgi:hypothetical protein
MISGDPYIASNRRYTYFLTLGQVILECFYNPYSLVLPLYYHCVTNLYDHYMYIWVYGQISHIQISMDSTIYEP